MPTDKFKNADAINGTKALEMIMRDVLDGMEEFASISGYSASPCEFEILGKEAPEKAAAKKQTRKRRKPADIVSFIEIREQNALKLSA